MAEGAGGNEGLAEAVAEARALGGLDCVSGAWWVRAEGDPTVGEAEVKVASGRAVSRAELSAVANERMVAIAGLGSGGFVGQVEGDVLVAHVEGATDVERRRVQAAVAGTWGALQGERRGALVEVGAFPLLAAVALVAYAGAVAYVLRGVVSDVVAAWSAKQANDARVQALLKADSEVASLVAGHLRAEAEAGRELPISGAMRERMGALERLQDEVAGAISAVKPASDSGGGFPWGWVAAGAGAVTVLMAVRS